MNHAALIVLSKKAPLRVCLTWLLTNIICVRKIWEVNLKLFRLCLKEIIK